MISKVAFSEGPLALERLQAAVAALRVQLPEDYVRFMLRYNGGRPKPSGFDVRWVDRQAVGQDWRTSSLSMLFPVADPPADSLVRMNQLTFAGRVPADTLAIGSDAGGNLLLLALGGPWVGKVLFWVKDHEVESGQLPGYENVGLIADNFTDLLDHRLR